MNENIDLTKILKDCPKGWKFWSPIFGEIEFYSISENYNYPIIISCKKGKIWFSKEGLFDIENEGAECLLFPSKDQRDWSKFSAPWYKKLVEPKFKAGDKIVNSLAEYMGAPGSKGKISEITDDKYIFTDGSYIFISNQDSWELVSNKKPKFNPKILNAFDRVIVRNEYDEWTCTLFSHIRNTPDTRFICATCESLYIYCVPYNDETKHLVGTDEEAPEYYRYWED